MTPMALDIQSSRDARLPSVLQGCLLLLAGVIVLPGMCMVLPNGPFSGLLVLAAPLLAAWGLLMVLHRAWRRRTG